MNNIEDKPLSKPIKTKPYFYASCLGDLQQIAKDLGYNLLVHGSLNRDMDLVAVPWSDEPATHFELLKQIDLYVRGTYYAEECYKSGYMHSVLPGGRNSYVINIERGGQYNNYEDNQYYLDISITPLVVESSAPQ